MTSVDRLRIQTEWPSDLDPIGDIRDAIDKAKFQIGLDVDELKRQALFEEHLSAFLLQLKEEKNEENYNGFRDGSCLGCGRRSV